VTATDQRRRVNACVSTNSWSSSTPSSTTAPSQPSLERFLKVVKKDGGSVDNVDIWGRRRLAYEIKKKAEGIYAVVNFTAEPATAKELDRQLGLNESVMRTKLLRPGA
jgi:small subunit ribosomal protein S6